MVEDFLAELDDARREQSEKLIAMMQKLTNEPPVMWGSSIIGFGSYHYKSKSGREGDWMKVGFSPRKGQYSLYLGLDADDFADELAKLGKHDRGKGCIYIKSLESINLNVLEKMIKKGYNIASSYAA